MRPAARNLRIGWLRISDVDFAAFAYAAIFSPGCAQITACSFSSSAISSARDRRARFTVAPLLFPRSAADGLSTRRNPRAAASAATFSKLAICSRTLCSTLSSILCSRDLLGVFIRSLSHNLTHELKWGTERLRSVTMRLLSWASPLRLFLRIAGVLGMT